MRQLGGDRGEMPDALMAANQQSDGIIFGVLRFLGGRNLVQHLDLLSQELSGDVASRPFVIVITRPLRPRDLFSPATARTVHWVGPDADPIPRCARDDKVERRRK